MATTAADVRAAYARACHAAALAGIDPSLWDLEIGSQTYSRAYRVWERDPSTGALSRPRALYDNVLGMTRRDAERALDGMRSAWLGVSHVRRDGDA